MCVMIDTNQQILKEKIEIYTHAREDIELFVYVRFFYQRVEYIQDWMNIPDLKLI